MLKTVLIGLLLPLLGTALGAAMVFFTGNGLKRGLQNALLGFASGVMIAASVWSLLLPALDMAEAAGGSVWLPAVAGFLLGAALLLALDRLIPHLHADGLRPEGKPARLSRGFLLVLAVTLHNFPEGMAVGVVLAGLLAGSPGVTAAGALSLVLGIAIQNFPEGAIISMPLAAGGMRRGRAFRAGFLSGIVEPVGAMLTMLLTWLALPVCSAN